MALITYQGMAEAIASLQPNPATLKGRLINLIHSYFPSEESLENIDAIAAEDLIRQLWDIADTEDIRQKKKNLSSLKSSINKDLKNLARQGKNPEGLVISRDNVFTVSDEHKNDLLQKLGLSGALGPKDLLSLLRGILAGVMQGAGGSEAASSLLKELDQTREMIVKAASITDDQAHIFSGAKTAETAGGDADEAAAGDEQPAAEEFEILEEAEILEEQAEISDEASEAASEAEAQAAAGELLVADEFEVLDEAEILEEDAEISDEASETASEAETEAAAGELLEPDEFEVLDEAEILEEDAEISDEASETASEAETEAAAGELLVADEFEVLDEQAEIVDEAAGTPGAGLAGGELTGPGQGQGGEAGGGGASQAAAGELLAADEFEVLDEAEILEEDAEISDEVPETTASEAETEAAAGELLEPDEFEVLDEQAEIVDEDEIAPVTGIAATDDGQSDAARPLDLSHYIEADEALAAPPETLTETHDDYIAQILERFMPKFIKIPAGSYPTGRDQPAYNERPARKILLQSFYIGQLPVTNDLFDFFVRETGYETDAEKAGFGNVVEGRLSNRIDADTGRTILSISRGTRSQRMQGANWRHPSGPDSSLENKGNHPVVQVSRRDALAFAAWAGKRLPSEDEWEAAARGQAGLLFPWGNEWHGELANTEASLTGNTTPVTRHGKPSMSPFGVYDLLGNVFEWTATVHTPSRPAGTRTPPVYVLKGGCWTSKTGMTAAARLLEPDTWSNTIGFRCAV